jgi:alkylresorcinol/alkylpyrone synthase
VLEDVLGRRALAQHDIAAWVWHGGGKNVLDALQLRLGLDDFAVRHSRAVLDACGNLSSAFVYFVLQAALQDRPPPGYWWMSSFGTGFSCHGALLELT